MTAHARSLPSFAQTFSSDSPVGSISGGNNSLPPIHSSSRRATSEEDRSRKRPRTEITSNAREDDPNGSERDSRLVQIKEEEDHAMLEDTPPPPQRMTLDQTGAPPPSSLRPPAAKKRRTGPQLNTDVRAPADSTTPISPAVSMGFTINNPGAIEQVRSMITVKQKQKALIEQRRASIVGSPNLGASGPAPALAEDRATPVKAPSTTRQRRSPNSGNNTRRVANGTQVRPPSPTPAAQPPPVAIQNSLPPPPISFARRRAEQLGGRRKPADIIISPREAHTEEQFQPAIQSAPPIPQASSQGSSFYSGGRFQMTLPRLPSVIGGGDTMRTVSGHVPPTPTRLSMQRNNSNTGPLPTLTHPAQGAADSRSPPAASVPIASTLVPPTPMSLHHPGYSGDKSAFLAPFGVFYDALNDSKQLKNWLGEQLQRSNTLIQNLTQQQEKLNETVEMLVERKVGGVRAEIAGLYRRVDELEDALRVATTGRRPSFDSDSLKAKGKQPLRNGHPMASDGYTFPPRPQQAERPRGDPSRRHASPALSTGVDSENGSPAPFDARRLSLSASRLDPPRQPVFEASSQRSTLSSSVSSPPLGFRESASANAGAAHPHPPPSHSSPSFLPRTERPVPPRQSSQVPSAVAAGERNGSHDSSRNSVPMPSPKASDES